MDILLETEEEKEMKKDWEDVRHRLDLVNGEFVENIKEESIEDLEFGIDYDDFDSEMYSLINDLSGNYGSMSEF